MNVASDNALPRMRNHLQCHKSRSRRWRQTTCGTAALVLRHVPQAAAVASKPQPAAYRVRVRAAGADRGLSTRARGGNSDDRHPRCDPRIPLINREPVANYVCSPSQITQPLPLFFRRFATLTSNKTTYEGLETRFRKHANVNAVDTTLARLKGIAGQFDGVHPVHVGASGSTGESPGHRASRSITLVRLLRLLPRAPISGVSDSMCDRSDRSGPRARRQRKPLSYRTSRRRKEWRVPSGLVRHMSET